MERSSNLLADHHNCITILYEMVTWSSNLLANHHNCSVSSNVFCANASSITYQTQLLCASTHPCQSSCMCVEQEIQMQIKDILHKNKINHNFQQKELNKFTSFCELCIIYPTGITSLADCKAEFSHK